MAITRSADYWGRELASILPQEGHRTGGPDVIVAAVLAGLIFASHEQQQVHGALTVFHGKLQLLHFFLQNMVVPNLRGRASQQCLEHFVVGIHAELSVHGTFVHDTGNPSYCLPSQ